MARATSAGFFKRNGLTLVFAALKVPALAGAARRAVAARVRTFAGAVRAQRRRPPGVEQARHSDTGT